MEAAYQLLPYSDQDRKEHNSIFQSPSESNLRQKITLYNANPKKKQKQYKHLIILQFAV